MTNAMPGYAVDVVRLPFPALPQDTVSTKTNDQARGDDTAELTIRKAEP